MKDSERSVGILQEVKILIDILFLENKSIMKI
jgi:hypothetical protein